MKNIIVNKQNGKYGIVDLNSKGEAYNSTRVALLFPSNDTHAVTAHLSMYAEPQSAGGEG